jgi:hypothetical protein
MLPIESDDPSRGVTKAALWKRGSPGGADARRLLRSFEKVTLVELEDISPLNPGHGGPFLTAARPE